MNSFLPNIEIWRSGYVLTTPITQKWSAKEWADAEALERRTVYANFSAADTSCSRVYICLCNTSEEAKRVVEEHNKFLEAIGVLGELMTTEKERHALEQQAVDSHNNTPGVGIYFDYRTASPLPLWYEKARKSLEKILNKNH